MKTKIGILILALCTTYFTAQAQRMVTTARATSYDISDNLDLDAVASIFGESKNLEDFEYRLNDPDRRISNLDLNQDGYIDYLRVIENSSDRNSLVVVQAVLDKDIYQDVATIEIEKNYNGNHRIQIVGDSYIYGSNYIIEPIYVHTPLIFSFFWGSHYSPWHSPYYWDYYPRWYSYYRPYSTFRYNRYITVNIDRHNTYNRASSRDIHFSKDTYNHNRRNDYATKYPDRSFQSRYQGIRNKNELTQRRSNGSENYQHNSNTQSSTVRSQSSNSRAGNNNVGRTGTESRNPVYKEKSAQTPSRVNTRSSNNSRPESNKNQVQQKTETRSQSHERPSVQRTQSAPAPQSPANRVEPSRRSSSPTVKSANTQSNNRSSSSRSNSRVKQSTQSSQKAAPAKKAEETDTNSRRRR